MQLGSMTGGEGGVFWPSGHCYEHYSGQVISNDILGYRICDKEQSE